MNDYEQIIYLLTIDALKHEARLSNRQIKLIQWEDFDGSKIRTRTGREVLLKPSTSLAMASLPKNSRYIFSCYYRPATLKSRANYGKYKLRKKWQSIPKIYIGIK